MPARRSSLPNFLKMNSNLKERLAGIRHVALDMDGTIYLGNTLFSCTLPFLETLNRLGISYSFLTNNPSKSLDDYISRLRKLGVPCAPEQMYSTTAAAIDYIRTHLPRAKRLFLLGTPSMISQFEAAGYESASDDPSDVPDALVVAFDKTLVYSRLCRAAWWASQGLPFVATNPDWVCPTDEQTVLVDCGSICSCIQAATGRKPDVVIGKPNPDILLGILNKHGIKPEEAAMVGDRLYTDVKTALNAGACGVLVLSGESTMETVRESEDVPTLICEDVGEFGRLLEEARL